MLAIIGGGASGLAAAIAAGQRARELGRPLQITLYEGDDRVGRSILATGNGRCNFSNSHLYSDHAEGFTLREEALPHDITHRVDDYHNNAFVHDVLDALQQQCGPYYVHRFFASCGLAWREEADGRQYPQANKASVVVDVLRAVASEYNVNIQCESKVACVEAPREPGKPFTLRMADGKFQRAQAVVIACGGRALQQLETPVLPRLPLRPVLGALKVKSDQIPLVRELDNIRVKCAVSLVRAGQQSAVATEVGELMFRKYGVSGICVFNLSRMAQPGDQLLIDFLQVGGAPEAEELLKERCHVLAQRFGQPLTCEALLRGLLLPRVSEALLKTAGLRPRDNVDTSCIQQLAQLLSAFPLTVEDIADPAQCQVRRGGLQVDAFSTETLEANNIPGLYAAGEALDVDGPCGGYNLHWAWASGLLAGTCAAQQLM